MNTIALKQWRFHYGDCEEAWYKGFPDGAWEQVDVPHDWSAAMPRSKSYSSGTGYAAGGTGWYRVHFTLPEQLRGMAVKVVFDGVYKNSQVWCNSYYLGKRPYGYSTFSYDITHAVVFGEAENVLSVKVTHTDIADSRWYTGSGLTRKVTLVCQERIHPQEYGVVFCAEHIEPDKEGICGSAQLTVRHSPVCAESFPGQFPAQTSAAQAERLRIRTAFEDAVGDSVLTLEGDALTGEECVLQGKLGTAQLWSVERPYLYTMKTWYAVNGGEFYQVDEQRVGIRSAVFDPDKGFFLNGRPQKLKGVCVHHDGGVLGAAVTPGLWQRRLETLKECGCNAIRCSHNPHMPELYSLCDELGFLMMDEAFDEWENAKNKWSTGHNVYPPKHQGYFEDFPLWHEADLRAMVRRDRNHPSVVLWSIGNEIDYPNDPYCHASFGQMTGNNDANKPAAERMYDPDKPDAGRLVTIARRLEQIVREEDDSRPVTLAAAFPELSAQTGLLDGLDVIGYNYKEHLYEADHKRFPDKPILGSENGHGYEQWLAVSENAYISGQFLWTGIDYLGESRGEWPTHGSDAGILTCAGDKKPEFYRRKAFWSKEPVLFLATRRASDGPEDWRPMGQHWNYAPGEEVLVKVYSNLTEISLELNGRNCGTLGEYNADGAYCFRLQFEPGTLRAQGRTAPAGTQQSNGAQSPAGTQQSADAQPSGAPGIYTAELSTVGEAVQLQGELWSSADVLTGQSFAEASAKRGYLYQLQVQLTDGQNRPVRWQEREIEAEVTGAGRLVGLDNGSLAEETPECAVRCRTFAGRLLVLVRRTGAGEIGITLRTGQYSHTFYA